MIGKTETGKQMTHLKQMCKRTVKAIVDNIKFLYKLGFYWSAMKFISVSMLLFCSKKLDNVSWEEQILMIRNVEIGKHTTFSNTTAHE